MIIVGFCGADRSSTAAACMGHGLHFCLQEAGLDEALLTEEAASDWDTGAPTGGAGMFAAGGGAGGLMGMPCPGSILPSHGEAGPQRDGGAASREVAPD